MLKRRRAATRSNQPARALEVGAGMRHAGQHGGAALGHATQFDYATSRYFSAFAPQIGQAAGGLPNSMCPQTGQR